MKHYVGLDVSMKETAICVVDEKRKVVKEGKVGRSPRRSRLGCDDTGSISSGSGSRRLVVAGDA